MNRKLMSCGLGCQWGSSLLTVAGRLALAGIAHAQEALRVLLAGDLAAAQKLANRALLPQGLPVMAEQTKIWPA
jgi:hypothetical protein